MKFNLPLPTTACLLLLALTPGAAPAQNSPNPQPPLALNAAVPAPTANPATGVPTAPDPLIAPDWPEPTIILTNVVNGQRHFNFLTTLTNVVYDGLPASEVARELQTAFQNKFDIMISPGRQDPSGNDNQLDPGGVLIKLQLHNVTATEIFRAMNLLLESEGSPVRWQLLVNGGRPLVLLRTVPELLPKAAHDNAPKQPMVYYVGDLMSEGGMTSKQIQDTLADVNASCSNGEIFIRFHEETQLIIVKGTGEQIALVRNTLDALKQKMLFTHYQSGQKGDAPKPGNSGGEPK